MLLQDLSDDEDDSVDNAPRRKRDSDRAVRRSRLSGRQQATLPSDQLSTIRSDQAPTVRSDQVSTVRSDQVSTVRSDLPAGGIYKQMVAEISTISMEPIYGQYFFFLISLHNSIVFLTSLYAHTQDCFIIIHWIKPRQLITNVYIY